MGMSIDEAWRHHVAISVDDLLSMVPDFANGGNLAVDNAHVGTKARQTRTINDGTIADDQVVWHRFSLKTTSDC
jgi:hypothetical protein